MNDSARLDYFRSEFEGKVTQLRAEFVEQKKRDDARIAFLEESLRKVHRELKEIRMSA